MWNDLKNTIKRKARNMLGLPQFYEEQASIMNDFKELAEQLQKMQERLESLDTSQLADRIQDCYNKTLEVSGRFYLTGAGKQEVDLRYQDLLFLLNRLTPFIPEESFTVKTDHPVALDSNDHLNPWGTQYDNTRSPRFVMACERHFPGQKLKYMDLGCSGGGLILDFLLRGHQAVGLEGSDFSLLTRRAEWRMLGNRNLFTADITKPFQVLLPDGSPYQAQVISSWEVLEHIKEEDLPQLFANVLNHLTPGGYFMGTISLRDDIVNGVSYHPTVKPQAWWDEKFNELGLPFSTDHSFQFWDYCRGTANGYFDGNYALQPELGFHFVARKPS